MALESPARRRVGVSHSVRARRNDRTYGGAIDSVEPDDRLVELAQQGDGEAYRRLVERHQDRIVGVTLRLLRNRDEALEAAQDVFIRAWRSLPRFERRARVSTWLHRIALNVCYDRLGRRRSNEVARSTQLGVFA